MGIYNDGVDLRIGKQISDCHLIAEQEHHCQQVLIQLGQEGVLLILGTEMSGIGSVTRQQELYHR
jgi:hypothetical protein